MSKKEEQQQTVVSGSPADVTSPVILKANTREELDQQFTELKAKHDGQTLTAGAVGRNSDDGTYILRVDIL